MRAVFLSCRGRNSTRLFTHLSKIRGSLPCTEWRCAEREAAGRGTHTYTWKVPERTGPGARDPSSVIVSFHNTAGLTGRYAVVGKKKSTN